MTNRMTLSTLIFSVFLFTACEEMNSVNYENSSSSVTDKDEKIGFVVIKKKYQEEKVRKDLLFGTGNYHKINHYIVGTDGELYKNRFSVEDWIISEVGDTLWTENKYNDFSILELKK